MKRIFPIVFITILALLLFTRPFDGNADFFHHITAGRQIVTTHTFPYTDTLTFTRYGKPWIAHSWASGVVFYILFSTFGPIAITLFAGFLGFMTVYLLWLFLGAFIKSNIAKTLTVVLTAVVMAIRWPHRPELFTYPFITLLLFIDTLQAKRPKFVLWHPLIILIWINLYGPSTILGIILLVFFGVKQWWFDGRKIRTNRHLQYYSIILSILASFASPNGIRTLFYITKISHVAAYEGEWAGIPDMLRLMPTSYLIGAQYSLIVYGLTIGIFLILAIVNRRLIREHFVEALLGLAIFIPIFAFRQAPLAIILASPFLAIMIERTIRYLPLSILIILIVIINFAAVLYVTPPGIIYNNTSIHDLTTFLASSSIRGNTLNQVELGSVLNYFAPNIKTFVDTRDDLFIGSESQQDLFNVMFTGASLPKLLAKYNVDIVVGDYITDAMPYNDLFYSPSWKLVFLNDRYFVLTMQSVVNRYKLTPIDSLDPYSPNGAKEGRQEDALLFYQHLLKTHPQSYYAHWFLGSLLLSLNKPAEALTALTSTSVENGPYRGFFLKELHVAQSIAYAKTGNCDKALSTLQQVPKDASGAFLVGLVNPMPTRFDKGDAWFQLYCRRDVRKASEALSRFLANPTISPAEKQQSQLLFAADLRQQTR